MKLEFNRPTHQITFNKRELCCVFAFGLVTLLFFNVAFGTVICGGAALILFMALNLEIIKFEMNKPESENTLTPLIWSLNYIFFYMTLILTTAFLLGLMLFVLLNDILPAFALMVKGWVS